MELMTKEVMKTLPPFGATDGTPLEDKVVAVKYFNPVGSATWYIFEGEPMLQNETDDGRPDWYLFGWCELFPGCGELGTVSLNELRDVRLPFGLGIERDLHIGKGWKFRDTPHGRKLFAPVVVEG